MKIIRCMFSNALSFFLAGCVSSIEPENKIENKESPMTHLNSASDILIAEKYWKLVDLDGKQVSMAKNQ